MRRLILVILALVFLIIGSVGCAAKSTVSATSKNASSDEQTAVVKSVNGSIVLVNYDDGTISDALNPFGDLKVGAIVRVYTPSGMTYAAYTVKGTPQIVEILKK